MSQFTVDESAFKREVHLFVNGKELFVSNADPRWTLLSFLRDVVGLKGTKLGCGEGGCGACTVMISYMHEEGAAEPTLRHVSANACLTPLCACDGAAVTTIEGMAVGDQLHPLQQKFLDHAALQCGVCTPGFLVAAKALLDRNSNPTETEVRFWLAGNLCRCTGYDKIVRAVLDTAAEMRG